jgi:hypothetical protein
VAPSSAPPRHPAQLDHHFGHAHLAGPRLDHGLQSARSGHRRVDVYLGIGVDERRAQHIVVRQKGRPHRFRIGLPPTGRTLNIGE